MAAITEETDSSFRLSMLIYDTRYRSMTIQVVALIGFMLGVGWLVSNAATNLANLGKPLTFGFLGSPAGYDINQRLIEYNSQSPHWRAALVGLLNTLLVAFLGCILATIIGVLVGVMRLSKNWLIAKLMTVYVEIFRNVPVLLWIVFAMAIFIETLPAPRAFRGDTPEATMYLWDSVAFTNRGFYIPSPVFGSGSLFVILVFIASLIGIWFFRRWAKAKQEATGEQLPVSWISLALFFLPAIFVGLLIANPVWGFMAIIRYLVVAWLAWQAFGYLKNSLAQNSYGTKVAGFLSIGILIMLLFISGYLMQMMTPADTVWNSPITLDNPELAGFNFKGGFHLRNSLIALWLALSFYTAAFIAEIVRAGIQSVSKGQSEAAGALGLRPNRTMNLVILPQALRVIIPPLISNYLNLTKNSSLAIAVGYMDITGTLGGITLNQTGREMECLILLMLIYLAISLTVSLVMNWYNASIALKER